KKLSARPQCRYVHLLREAAEAVAGRQCDLAALVPPAGMGDVERIAGGLEKMPPKSTYFYPKVLSGLVFNPLKGSCTALSLSGGAASPVPSRSILEVSCFLRPHRATVPVVPFWRWQAGGRSTPESPCHAPQVLAPRLSGRHRPVAARPQCSATRPRRPR